MRWSGSRARVRARVYRLRQQADGTATVLFGDGRDGVRPPPGQENVTARWRDGIGPAGNLRAGTLTLLVTRPLGLKGVTNPLPASGGAGPDPAEALRRRLPIAARGLDRLVSASDYADFALNFAGIGKATAALLTVGGRQVLHVTVAGIEDTPLDPAGDLLAMLEEALRRYGDPDLPVEVSPCERLALVLRARLLLDPDHRMAEVEAAARAALLARFGYEAVELGQDLFRAAAIAALQAVPGVAAVAVDRFTALSQDTLAAAFAGDAAAAPPEEARERLAVAPARPAPMAEDPWRIAPAQLCALLPSVPAAWILEELRPS